MLLTIAFACFAVLVVSWMLLPSSARATESPYEGAAELDTGETVAA